MILAVIIKFTNDRIDAMMAGAKRWDYAAGAIILEEAGGKVTDFSGNQIDWSNQNTKVIGTNGIIHDEFVKIYNQQ